MGKLRRKVWALGVVAVSFVLTGCGAEGSLTNFGKSLGDVFKGFKMP